MSVTLATEESFGGMARQMGKILEQLNKGYYSFYPSETWTPNVNLYETEHSYQVCVDLAGVDKDKIELAIHSQRLTIKGQRAVPIVISTDGQPGSPESGQQKRTRIHLMEIDHGSFARVVELPPDVAERSISAEYRNGLLWIELPKK